MVEMVFLSLATHTWIKINKVYRLFSDCFDEFVTVECSNDFKWFAQIPIYFTTVVHLLFGTAISTLQSVSDIYNFYCQFTKQMLICSPVRSYISWNDTCCPLLACTRAIALCYTHISQTCWLHQVSVFTAIAPIRAEIFIRTQRLRAHLIYIWKKKNHFIAQKPF